MSRVLVCLAVVFVVVIAIYFVSGATVDHYCGDVESLPEIEFIQNDDELQSEVDFVAAEVDMVDDDGIEIVPHAM